MLHLLIMPPSPLQSDASHVLFAPLLQLVVEGLNKYALVYELIHPYISHATLQLRL